MGKISIITVNYNNSDGLEKTINSVINQTLLDFEFIIIDGGSTDESIDIIKRYENNIDCWLSESDTGIYNAMNKGVKLATGEYLLFLNSGDHFFDKKKIEESTPHLNSKDIIYFNVEIKSENTAKLVSYPENLRFSYFYNKGFCHQAVFIKRNLFETFGLYDETQKIIADWKFFLLTIFKYNCSYKKVNKTLSTYYLGGISSQVNFFEERNRVLNEYFGGFVKDYQEFSRQKYFVNSNRFIMLKEIEKTTIGAKLVSLIFRVYIALFSKTKLKDILSNSKNKNATYE